MNGRCSPKVPQDATEEEKEGWEEAHNDDYYDARTPKIDRKEEFKSITENAAVLPTGESWTSKLAGDTQTYNKKNGDDGTVSYAVNVLKSLRWPGAVTVCKEAKFTNVYVGNGMKREDVVALAPPVVEAEAADLQEQLEPTPFNEPPPVVQQEEEEAE